MSSVMLLCNFTRLQSPLFSLLITFKHIGFTYNISSAKAFPFFVVIFLNQKNAKSYSTGDIDD